MSGLDDTRVCPHCGERRSIFGYHHHERTCAKRPPDEALIELRRNGESISRIAARFQVSGYIVHQWLREVQAARGRRNGLETYPEIAPMFGQTSGCKWCRAGVQEICQKLVWAVGWVLCEAPDTGQMVRRRAMFGVDLEILSAAIMGKDGAGVATEPRPGGGVGSWGEDDAHQKPL